MRSELWNRTRRPAQIPPDAPTWYVRGGRGSGKTRTGSEALAEWIRQYDTGDGDWAVIAPTFSDARDICMEGESGLLRSLIGMYDPVRWNRSMGQLHLRNGATVFTDGADDGALRIQGKNLRGAWCDEVGLWRISTKDGHRLGARDDALEVKAWDESIQFAVRKEPGLLVVTGTPKRGHILVRRLINDSLVIKTHMTMADNRANLLPARIDALTAKYGDTALGRQELGGEYVDEIEGALWLVAQIDASRLTETPRLTRIIVAVDPPGGATECGIVVVGMIAGQCPCGDTNLPHAAVLEDRSLFPSGPNHWAAEAINAYHDHTADRVVGEINYGGDMVMNTIANLDGSVHTGTVRATRGKILRAEPIAGLYGDPARSETWTRSRVHHIGRLPELEDEMLAFSQEEAGLWSPNRLDALVWAITELDIAATRPMTSNVAAVTSARIR